MLDGRKYIHQCNLVGFLESVQIQKIKITGSKQSLSFTAA